MGLHSFSPGTARLPLPHDPSACDDGDARWCPLLAQVGAQIAGPLSAAIERVQALSTSGRIDALSLQRLGEELAQARRVGMASQQIARYASRRVRQSHERVDLTAVLQAALAARRPQLLGRGLPLRTVLRQVAVIVDPALLTSLLDALLDWLAAHAGSAVEVRLDTKAWPVHGRLACRFRPRAAAPGDSAADEAEDIDWQLLAHAAAVMGVALERRQEAGLDSVTLEFPRTVNEQMQGLAVLELDDPHPSTRSRPLAGCQVLVLSGRRELRSQVRDAVRELGLVLDFVGSVEEAAAFCGRGLPHALVYESLLRGERLDRLRHRLESESPDMAFIEIAEEGWTFEVSGLVPGSVGRVGRQAIASALPSALTFELTRSL
ncbi:hypothetical protein [Eleftheria terrae]|uniref:hypothetical protein n=1 Tax=Eleftheria terrae TaxID=1597781 RepID=UPI00263BC013|nr:hypothetical protein [Eleftheria terrae]WKB51874.1 hypothetical protein N7L95_19005 [Eleftheria terrae]